MAEKNRIIPDIILIIIGGIAILILIRFCPNKPSIKDEKIALLHQQHLDDSIMHLRIEKELIDSANKIKKSLDSASVVFNNTSSSLQDIISQDRRLIAKYKSQIAYKNDTNTILVPPEFVNDCKDCFTQLESTTNSAEQYKSQAEQMQLLYINQDAIDSQQISELQWQKFRLNIQYNQLRASIEVNAKSLEPRRKLKIGIAGRFDNQFMPNGIGPAVMYQDKRDRNFGFIPLYGKGDPTYIGTILVPFSLRK